MLKLLQKVKNWLGRKLLSDDDLLKYTMQLEFTVEELNDELTGMLISVGELERQRRDWQTISTGLLSASAMEQQSLKLDFLQELYKSGITSELVNDGQGNVVVRLVSLVDQNQDATEEPAEFHA